MTNDTRKYNVASQIVQDFTEREDNDLILAGREYGRAYHLFMIRYKNLPQYAVRITVGNLDSLDIRMKPMFGDLPLKDEYISMFVALVYKSSILVNLLEKGLAQFFNPLPISTLSLKDLKKFVGDDPVSQDLYNRLERIYNNTFPGEIFAGTDEYNEDTYKENYEVLEKNLEVIRAYADGEE